MESKESKDNNKKRYRLVYFIPELCVLAVALLGIWLVEHLMSKPMYQVVTDMVMAALGIGVVGLLLRQQYFDHQLSYDNEDHILRFWVSMFIGLAVSLLCSVLPVGGWPYVVVYITLALCGSQSLGILGASVLLMISTLLHDSGINAFMLYFISGLLGTVLFRNLGAEFKVGIPLLISQMVLLVCETTNLLAQNPGGLLPEQYVIPAANMVVSSVLLIGILKWFSANVIFKDKNIYSDLLNTDGALLSQLKQLDKVSYYQCMHTAYFCDRIARKLGLDPEPIRTAGYYQKIGNILDDKGSVLDNTTPAKEEKKNQENQDMVMVKAVEAYLQKNHFPQSVRQILREYLIEEERIVSKEATILIFADAVVSSVSYLFSKDPNLHPDFDKLVDGVFRKGLESGILKYSSITQRELTQMKKIFKEEKLYYDFIRGK